MTHHFWDNPWFQRIIIPLVVIVLGGLTTRLVTELLVEDPQTTTAEVAVVEDIDKYNLSLDLRNQLDNNLLFPVQEVALKVTSKDADLLAQAEEIKKYLKDQGFEVKGPEMIKGKEKTDVDAPLTFHTTKDSKKMEVVLSN